MTDDRSLAVASVQDWMLDQLRTDEPAVQTTEQRTASAVACADAPAAFDDDDQQTVSDVRTPQRDNASRGERRHATDPLPLGDLPEASGADINSAAKRIAVRLGSGTLVVAVLIVVALLVFGGAPRRVAPVQHHGSTPALSAVPSTATAVVPQNGQGLPFAAWTDSCTPGGGSTDQLAARSPQALTDTANDSAWVCGRGPQESLLDGQILHVQFTCDPASPSSACSYMFNGVSVTPGWVAKTPAGREEWLQHRVVTRLQFNFFNGNQLAADPFYLDTRSVHGPVSATLPTKILASRVEVIVLHTERPPVAPTPTTSAPGQRPDASGLVPPGGLVDSVLGPDGTEAASPPPAEPVGGGPAGDPVDATFAVSRLQFFGHSPA